jgi:uncharacterized lipoprotein YmbA
MVTLALAGCLFRATEPPRFYRPASAALDGAVDAPDAAQTGAAVRLGSVHSAPFLRERIVWRASPVEYGLYEQRRWFELPSRYVRRALTATLQSTPGLRLGDEPTAARLDVEILAFDEILAPAHEAYVAVSATLRDGTQKRFDRTFAAHVPIASVDGGATAESIGHALDEVVKKVATATASVLGPKTTTTGRGHRAKASTAAASAPRALETEGADQVVEMRTRDVEADGRHRRRSIRTPRALAPRAPPGSVGGLLKVSGPRSRRCSDAPRRCTCST